MSCECKSITGQLNAAECFFQCCAAASNSGCCARWAGCVCDMPPNTALIATAETSHMAVRCLAEQSSCFYSIVKLVACTDVTVAAWLAHVRWKAGNLSAALISNSTEKVESSAPERVVVTPCASHITVLWNAHSSRSSFLSPMPVPDFLAKWAT